MTLPSFLGFIKPRRKPAMVSFGLGVTAVILGISSMFSSDIILAGIFNIVLLGCVITFGRAAYIFGGFDNREYYAYSKVKEKLVTAILCAI